MQSIEQITGYAQSCAPIFGGSQQERNTELGLANRKNHAVFDKKMRNSVAGFTDKLADTTARFTCETGQEQPFFWQSPPHPS